MAVLLKKGTQVLCYFAYIIGLDLHLL